MSLTVVIPTLNESASIATCLARVRETFDGEVLVADGGSIDETLREATPLATNLLRTEKGLAFQLNAAVASSSSDTFLFLSADCRLPRDWKKAIEVTLSSPYVAVGGFTLALDDDRFLYRLLAFGGNLRSRYFSIAFPDQGLFFRRSVFETVGGLDVTSRIPFAKFCVEARKHGQFVLRPEKMLASVREWRERGLWRATWSHIRRFSEFRRYELPKRY